MSSDLLSCVVSQIGGGWGEETPKDGFEKVAVIRGTDIPRVRDGDFTTVPHRFEKSTKLPQRLLQPGDLVIETSGGSAASGQHTGRVVHITKEIISRLGGRAIPASFCKLVRLDPARVSSKYCAYLIDLFHLTDEIAVFENQSTGIANFQTSKFLAATTPVLQHMQQLEVAAFFERLDSLRVTLMRTNTALESIAQTLFRSWFVDFDPVHAKLAGNAPEAMSAELAELFPSEFEDSELGLIPKGWTAGRLNAICSLNPESWSTSRHPAILNYVDLSGLKKNVVLASERYSWSDAPSRARRVLRKGDSLYGTVRPGNLSYGYIGANSEALTGSTGFAVLRPNDAESAEFVYCAMTLRENIERLTHLAEGAAYPAVRPDIVHEQELVLPSSECLKAFHRVVSPLFAQGAVNSQLVKELGALRDHLLPRLISGKLRLEDAEASVEAITSVLEAEPA